MSLITIDRTLVTQEQNADPIFYVDEDCGNAAETGSKSSHSEDFFVRKTSAVTLSVKSQRRISVVRDHDNLHEHLKRILQILRFNDYVKLIVKLENPSPNPVWIRYLAIISTVGSQNSVESMIMGIDMYKGDASIGFIMPIYQDMVITLDGDGGFKLIIKDNVRLFKPISVQALWAAHQAIMQCCKVAQQNDYHSKGLSHGWISHYAQFPTSKPFMMFEWNKMEDIEDMCRASPPSADLGRPISEDERKSEEFRNTIRLNLQRIMGTVDLEDVNVVQLREMLEAQMGMSLKDQRQFIADQVLNIYGQMDVPSLIFDHLLLGSSFNASNGDELRRNNVTHIVNVTREIDNFFPADQFVYKNIRVYDDEKAQLLPYWDETFKFINEARANGTRCLVHCKMGISRSGSTTHFLSSLSRRSIFEVSSFPLAKVVAYAMKEMGWKLDKALEFVRNKRSCVNPNANFLRQLETYQGILEASSHRHSALFQQTLDKGAESSVTNVARTCGESPPDTKMDVAENYEAYEPPPGPSGPVDLEAELFAFKTFPQLPLIQEEPISKRSPSPELPSGGGGIRRLVLATTSQRIRHWHPDIYEDMDNIGGSGVVISRSKSSPTSVFRRHQPPLPPPTQVSTSKEEPTQFAVPLVSSARSPLNNTTITSAVPSNPSASDSPSKEEESDISILVPPPSPAPLSDDETSSVSEHDVFLVPTVFRSQIAERSSTPKARPVTINIVPPGSSDLSESLTEPRLPAPAEHQANRLTLSLVTMAPDEEQSHRPVRTLSLRLRPDDSWIMKRQASEEGDEVPKRPLDCRPVSDTTPATTSITPPEPLEEEEVEVHRTALDVVPTLPFQNPMPTVIAASQQ
ncbi:hypothetical protein Aperf_G00000061940 [Anoplocephala perfoliata]